MCNGHKKFESKQAARRALSGKQARGTFKVMHVYQCPMCHYWHTAHKTQA